MAALVSPQDERVMWMDLSLGLQPARAATRAKAQTKRVLFIVCLFLLFGSKKGFETRSILRQAGFQSFEIKLYLSLRGTNFVLRCPLGQRNSGLYRLPFSFQ